jgi:hypothetical protein
MALVDAQGVVLRRRERCPGENVDRRSILLLKVGFDRDGDGVQAARALDLYGRVEIRADDDTILSSEEARCPCNG